MLNSYYTEFCQNYEGEMIRYGYTFRAPSILAARLFARSVAEKAGFTMIFRVWRISHDEHVKLYSPYRIPTLLPEELEKMTA